MNVKFILNARGQFCLLHDEPFPENPPDYGVFTDTSIAFIFPDGSREPVELELSRALAAEMTGDMVLLVVRTENDRPVEGYATPFLRDASCCWGLPGDPLLLRVIDRALRTRLVIDRAGDQPPARAELSPTRLVIYDQGGNTLVSGPRCDDDIHLLGPEGQLAIVELHNDIPRRRTLVPLHVRSGTAP